MPDISILGSLKNAAFSSWLNILIIFVPLGYIAHFLNWPVVAVFVLNYLAIIPLSALMGFATEEVSIRLGRTWGSVVNACFGNAVELIVAVIALIEEEYRIVQAGLIGSVLSNTLLVLGCAFFAGGLHHRVQIFHAEAAQCAGALLALSVLSMIIPAAYHDVHASGGEITNGILIMSRGTALILLLVYILFLVFQLKTHSDIFDGSHTRRAPQMRLWIASALLVIISVLVAFSSDILVDSVQELTSHYNISHTFVGMILLPIAASAAEHTMSITVAIRDKMDLCITVAVGSSMQMTLFVLPTLIIIAWIMKRPLTLFFDEFETTTMLISVLVINYLIMNGRSNWLKGAMLLSSYFIVAMAFFLYPADVDNPKGGIDTQPTAKSGLF
ncbi:calcium/proton exchanger [Coemansia spiralis]|nr:calcium/proton exchanger [Coemansia spiralis]